MAEYTPTPYDTKLESLILSVGEALVQLHTLYHAGGKTFDEITTAIQPYIERQKLLCMARTPEYVRYLEEKRGLV